MARKGDGVPKSIVVMEVPESTISKIMKNIKSGTPEGMPISHPDEFIFSPQTFDILNDEAKFIHVPIGE